jgi:hypothetical protein
MGDGEACKKFMLVADFKIVVLQININSVLKDIVYYVDACYHMYITQKSS